MAPARTRSRAFTILELIVTLVILAVLAVIAVPTYRMVIERTHDKSAQVSLSAYAREVQAIAALRGADTFEAADFEAAATDMHWAGAPGVTASGLDVSAYPSPALADRNEEEGWAVISYSLEENNTTALLTAVSAADHCVAVRMTATTTAVVEDMPHDKRTCYGGAINDEGGVLNPDPGVEISPISKDLVAPILALDAIEENIATVSWDPVPGALGYEVSISSEESMVGAQKQRVGSQVTSLDLPAAVDVKKYVVVTATQGTKTSPASNQIPLWLPLPAPDGLAGTMYGTEVRISWNPVPGAAAYEVYRAGVIAADVRGGETAFKLIPHPAGTTDTFTVLAKNALGKSPESSPITVTATPAVPQDVVAVGIGTDVKISWTPVNGADGYRVLQYFDRELVRVAPGQDTSSVTVPVGAGQSVRWVVVSYNGAGQSAVSRQATAITIPTVPTNVRVERSGSARTLVWSSSARASGYNIYVNGSTTPIDVGTSRSYALDYPAGSSTSIVVRAYNATGLSGAAAPVVATMPPVAVASATASSEYHRPAFQWAPSYGATYYLLTSTESTVSATATGTSTTLSLSPSTAPALWTWVIQACNTGGCSTGTPASTAPPPPPPAVPGVPQNLTASVSGLTANLSWSASANATSYYVYMNGQAAPILEVSGTTATVPMYAAEQRTYHVRAQGITGQSGESNKATVTTGAPAPQLKVVRTGMVTGPGVPCPQGTCYPLIPEYWVQVSAAEGASGQRWVVEALGEGGWVQHSSGTAAYSTATSSSPTFYSQWRAKVEYTLNGQTVTTPWTTVTAQQ